MRKFTLPLVIVLLALPALADDDQEKPSVSVTGSAEVRVVPDEVLLNVGVETFGQVLSAAKARADAAIRRAMDVSRRHGIPGSRVQTEYISIEPTYQFVGSVRRLHGYEVRRALTIRLNEIGKFEALLTDLMDAGLNTVRSVEFRTTELRKHRDEARRLAVIAAREKAEALATHAGRKLGAATRISEQGSGWWSAYGWWWGGRSPAVQNVVQVAPETGGGAPPEGSLAPGQITVSASVSVTYELQ